LAASTPFLHFSDHEPELGRKATEGRRAEFAGFGRDPAEVPDPQAESTFTASRLRWEERANPPHAAMIDWYRTPGPAPARASRAQLRRLPPEPGDDRGGIPVVPRGAQRPPDRCQPRPGAGGGPCAGMGDGAAPGDDRRRRLRRRLPPARPRIHRGLEPLRGVDRGGGGSDRAAHPPGSASRSSAAVDSG
jgi:hypothetical protein